MSQTENKLLNKSMFALIESDPEVQGRLYNVFDSDKVNDALRPVRELKSH